jgi:multicomponent Na+:H+ antiporter subunit A
MTTVTSFLLIGFEHREEASRSAALQALLVTGGGGLTLLAGLVLLTQVTGETGISALLLKGEAVKAHAAYPAILTLVLLGAFAKSAQVPFHFWLPNAMAAPTPVSAYLHSATMVKAGIYLMARFHPVLGGTPAWEITLTAVGGLTVLTGAYMAVTHTDLKHVLAYSTVGALGLFTLLLGLGTAKAVTAALLYLLAHALYKGGLFMVAGILHHETGIREAESLGGLWRAMPVTALAAGLAFLSKSGLTPFVTFLAKEETFAATLSTPFPAVWSWIITGAVVLVSISFVTAGAIVGVMPFFGGEKKPDGDHHEASLTFFIGPLVLAAAGLAFGFLHKPLEHWILSPAVAAVRGEVPDLHMVLLPHPNLKLALSGLAIAAGLAIYWFWTQRFRRAVTWFDVSDRLGPEATYRHLIRGVHGGGWIVGCHLQSGNLRRYLLLVVMASLVLVGIPLLQMDLSLPVGRNLSAYPHELALAVIMLVATVLVVMARSRMTAIAALGVVGYGMALFFLLFSAPDLAMTQFGIETLSVILLVLVVYRLPPRKRFIGWWGRSIHAVAALAVGAMVVGLMAHVLARSGGDRIGSYFLENSYDLAHGRNVVNVILVDFRGFDTMGEITVISIAALGVYALLRLVPRTEKRGEEGPAS